MPDNKLFTRFRAIVGFALLFLLTGCGDTPPSIDFTTPEGQVINCSESENLTQTIEGRVVQGTNGIRDLYVGNEEVGINPDGSFSHIFDLTASQDDLFSICTFKIKDTKGISNKERITFIKGEEPGNIGVPFKPNVSQGETSSYLDYSVTVKLTEWMVNVAANSAQDIINNNFAEFVEASGVFPYRVLGDDGSWAWTDITGVSIEGLSWDYIDLKEKTSADPGDIVIHQLNMDKMVISGKYKIFVQHTFSITISNVVANNIGMEVWFDAADNDIDLRLNLRALGDDFFTQFVSRVVVDGRVTTLGGGIEFLMKVILQFFDIRIMNFSIMDVKYLGMTFSTKMLGYEDNTIYGIPLPPMPLHIDTWFPQSYVYKVNANDEMDLHLGLAINPINDPAVHPDAVASPNPIGHYYSTPDDALPVLELATPSNLTVGLNDDLINMGAWAAMEAGGFDGLNITAQFQYLTGQALANSVFKKAVAKVYMQTPPIADFSGDLTEIIPDGDGIVNHAGTFKIRDMIIEVTDLIANQVNDRAVLSIDTDASINLRISDDGKRIEGFMDDDAVIHIAQLYYGNVELTNLAALAPAITRYVADLAIKSLIKLNVPKIDIYDANIQPAIQSIQVGENNMLVNLLIAPAE